MIIPMKPFKLLLIAILAQGCATTSVYENVLRDWVGHSTEELEAAWGPPIGVRTKPNGNQVYTYYNQSGATYIGMGYSRSNFCQTMFTADPKGIIIHWNWVGNACRKY